MPECITFKPVHSAEYPYSVGIRFDRNRLMRVHELIDHFNHLAAWCDEHLEPGSWTIEMFTKQIYFKKESDLLMFKLRWC